MNFRCDQGDRHQGGHESDETLTQGAERMLLGGQLSTYSGAERSFKSFWVRTLMGCFGVIQGGINESFKPALLEQKSASRNSLTVDLIQV